MDPLHSGTWTGRNAPRNALLGGILIVRVSADNAAITVKHALTKLLAPAATLSAPLQFCKAVHALANAHRQLTGVPATSVSLVMNLASTAMDRVMGNAAVAAKGPSLCSLVRALA